MSEEELTIDELLGWLTEEGCGQDEPNRKPLLMLAAEVRRLAQLLHMTQYDATAKTQSARHWAKKAEQLTEQVAKLHAALKFTPENLAILAEQQKPSHD